MDLDRATELKTDLKFIALYDELDDAVVAAYQQADSRCFTFAMEHGIDSWDVWSLVREEASSRGDTAIEAIADDAPATASGAPPLTAIVAGAAITWAVKKWNQRRAR